MKTERIHTFQKVAVMRGWLVSANDAGEPHLNLRILAEIEEGASEAVEEIVRRSNAYTDAENKEPVAAEPVSNGHAPKRRSPGRARQIAAMKEYWAKWKAAKGKK